MTTELTAQEKAGVVRRTLSILENDAELKSSFETVMVMARSFGPALGLDVDELLGGGGDETVLTNAYDQIHAAAKAFALAGGRVDA